MAGATLNQIPMDWHGNVDRIVKVISEARAAEVDLLCLPELCISGYGCEDWFLSLDTVDEARGCLMNLAEKCGDIAVVLSLPILHQDDLYNCAVVVQNRKILGFNPKKVLARQGLHYEPRWFKPWQLSVTESIKLDGTSYPFGDLCYEFAGFKVAIEICEEAWDQGPTSVRQARSGADLIVNPSASHFALGKYETRVRLVTEISRALQAQYLYTNLVGNEAGRVIYDGGVIIAECGKMVAAGPRFGFKDHYLTICDLNPRVPTIGRLKSRAVRHTTVQKEPDLVVVNGAPFPEKKGAKLAPSSHQTGTQHKEYSVDEEFLLAETLGLFDYLRKSGAKGYVVSLSGGCDSSVCALLVSDMVKLAMTELSAQGFAQRLGESVAGLDSKVWTEKVLTCIYMATEHSGKETEASARSLAEELSCRFYFGNVQKVVDAYLRTAQDWLAKPLTWQTDDTTLQNIQARSRAPLSWLMANKFNAILITTSNRSEAALGYATMDGDTAGGLAPIAGISKDFLSAWLKWREKGALDLGPLGSLAKVNALQPTAELRPKEEAQTDEADLMPYAISRKIEEYFIGKACSRHEIVDFLKNDFPKFSPEEHQQFVSKFLKLWVGNQWKRERFAPSFHIEDPSVDPKTWCRYPILSDEPK